MSLLGLAAGVLIPAAAAPSQLPSERVDIALPASAADLAVNRLAARTGVNVVVEVDLHGRHTPALAGRYTVDEAFERLLTPVGARAVRIGPGVYRVETRPPPRSQRPPSLPPPQIDPVQLDEVVVTAPVGRGLLDGVSGRSVFGGTTLAGSSGQGATDTISDLSASVESTRQGFGRSKLFVRGMADSALSGPLQATIGQYVGDIRLGFGVPDPDLMLVDFREVEVFEGPQGARFGAGSIGGVLRLEPERPDPSRPLTIASAGVSATRGGAAGADAAMVLNQPVAENAALRLVVYGRQDGGVVDSPTRGADTDRIDVVGGRIAYLLAGPGWTLDLLAMSQGVSASDTPLTDDPDRMINDRTSAQPYEGRLSLVGGALTRRWSDVRMTTAIGATRQTLDETFDASVPEAGSSAIVRRRQQTEAASIESRVDTDLGSIWQLGAGVSFAEARTHNVRTRSSVDPALGVDRVEVDRTFEEAALFGELVARVGSDHALSLGGRVSHPRNETKISGPNVGAGANSSEVEVLFTPSLGWTWNPSWGGHLFARYEEGVRPGDLSEVQGSGRPYRPDRVRLLEVGAASRRSGPWALEASAGLIRWTDIQSDIITVGGDLATANIGDGRIAFLRLTGFWRATSRLHLSGGLFLNRSKLRLDGASLIGTPEAELPNVAPVSGRLGVEYGPVSLGDHQLILTGNLRHVGETRSGLGPGLETPQGGYSEVDLSARLETDRYAYVLSAANLFDATAPRFAIGAPYRLYDGGVVPLRPLTIRFGIETRF